MGEGGRTREPMGGGVDHSLIKGGGGDRTMEVHRKIQYWNAGKFLPDNTAEHPRRQPSSYLPQWEPEISPGWISFRVADCQLRPRNSMSELVFRTIVLWRGKQLSENTCSVRCVTVMVNTSFAHLTVGILSYAVYCTVAECTRIPVASCFILEKKHWSLCCTALRQPHGKERCKDIRKQAVLRHLYGRILRASCYRQKYDSFL
jgi:hypothetical protein